MAGKILRRNQFDIIFGSSALILRIEVLQSDLENDPNQDAQERYEHAILVRRR